jgi:hypothetical protein
VMRLVRGSAIYTIAVAAVLGGVVAYRSDSPVAVGALFVLPPALGGFAALRWTSRSGLALASFLVGAPAVLSLAGGVGFLLLPPASVFLVAALRKGSTRWSDQPELG